MSRIVLLLTICFFFSVVALPLYAQNTFSEINAAASLEFSRGNYELAAKKWISLEKSGYSDPNLFTNVGHAFSNSGKIPEAMLYYEKALRFKPSGTEIQNAIKDLRERMADAVMPLEPFFLVKWIHGFISIFRPGIWALGGLSLLLLAVVYWLMRMKIIKGALMLPKINPLILVAAGIFFILIAIVSYNRIYRSNEAIIFTACESRQGPAIQSPLIRTLHPGEKIIIQDQLSDWYKISLLNLDEAWVKKECLRKIDLRETAGM